MSAAERVEVDSAAFDFRPRGRQANGAAALCLHGLTGTPYEVRPVAEALVARGVRARGPWMAGHEEGVEVLSKTPWQAWVDEARRELDALRAEHDRVFLVGMSMGGLASLRLAETEEIDAMVVIGTPLVLAPPVPQLLPLLRYFVSSQTKKGGSDIRDPAARARHPSMTEMPFSAVAELISLQSHVIPELAKVRAPILVAHGRFDRTARPRDAERIIQEVGSSDKELFYLERSGHVATVDYDGPALARAAADFLGRR
jgi:carboxylesterase